LGELFVNDVKKQPRAQFVAPTYHQRFALSAQFQWAGKLPLAPPDKTVVYEVLG
jgi:hypothetical protein